MEQGIATTRLEDDPDDRFVRLRAALGVSSFGLNQIVLRPGQRQRIHRHERQEEVYVVLDGTLTLLVEGEERTFERGELVRVAPELRRQMVNRGPGTLSLLALGGAGEHDGRDGLAYPDWETSEPVSPRDLPLPDDLPADERRG
ncbi:MAG TPA: cupin domain-containing protein [Solirubrobacteraceae bacterium]|jgi:uncharacterized cupin superfamily protein|nr:cupin domain-containing protein [Solirubrobacteraceae bacterium]